MSRAEPPPAHHQVIVPGSRLRPVDLGELWRFRHLFLALTRRDLTLRYRQTRLGPAWIVLQPLIGAAIFAFIFGNVIRLRSNGVPYFLYAYAGLLAWNPFSNTLLTVTGSLVANVNLVSKIYFPRLLLLFSQVGSKLLDFLVSLAVFLLLAPLYGVAPAWRAATIPVWMALAFLLALGPGLILSALNVTYRDVAAIVSIGVPFLLYLSPVAYGVGTLPAHLRALYNLNPLVGLVGAFRWALLPHSPLEGGQVAYSAVVTGVLLLIGLFFFRSRERRFADEI